MPNLRERGACIEGLHKQIRSGRFDLEFIPKSLKIIIDNEDWKEFQSPTTGETIKHETFNSFVTAKFPRGLSTTVEILTNLCRHETDVVTAIAKVTQKEHGGDRKSDQIKSYDIRLEDTVAHNAGTGLPYALRRLSRDRPDLHEEVLAKRISAHAAMVQAGFLKKPTRLDVLQSTWKKTTDQDRKTFLAWIKDYPNTEESRGTNQDDQA